MKIEMVKLNRIKYAHSEEERKLLTSDGYVPAQTKTEKRQAADPENGQAADSEDSKAPDSEDGQTVNPENGQAADSDSGQTTAPDKSQTTNKRGTKNK